MKVTSTDIKNSFGKYLRFCATEPVYITKNGKTIAKLINHSEEDEIIEESAHLREVYDVDRRYNVVYARERVAEASESYNLDRLTMTYDEFLKMNENSQNRYEFIDGEIYLLSAPSVFHQRIVSRLHIALDKFLVGKPCDVFESPFDVKLYRRGNEKFTNVVQPDVLVVCNWRDELNDKGRYEGIPRLVVEVLSPGNTRKEMFTKLDLYRDSGIEEYWIIDDLRHLVIIYKFEDYDVVATKVYKGEDVCSSFIYEGFEFVVAE